MLRWMYTIYQSNEKGNCTNKSKISEMHIGPCQTAMLDILCEKWQSLEIQINFYSKAATTSNSKLQTPHQRE